MAKFRKKEVLVEAVQLLWSTWSEMCEFIDAPGGLKKGNPEGCYVDANRNITEDTNGRIGLRIPTLLYGELLGVEGDWIVREPSGELFPYSGDSFAESFAPAADLKQYSTAFDPNWDRYPLLLELLADRPARREELRALLVDARADAVRFVNDVRVDELAKARVDERRRIALLTARARLGGSPGAVTVRELSDEELLQALRNVGCDLQCDACAETFFTGSAMHNHTCGADDKKPSFQTMELVRGASAACKRAEANPHNDYGDVGGTLEQCGAALRAVLEEFVDDNRHGSVERADGPEPVS